MERQGRISVYQSEDDAVLSHHFHNAYELIFIEEGEASFVVDGKERVYGAGSLIFLSNLERHQMLPLARPYRRYVAMIEPDLFDSFVREPALCSIFKRRPANFRNGIPLEREDATAVREALAACVREADRQAGFWEEAVLSLLLTLFIRLYRRYGGYFPAAEAGTGHAGRIQAYLDSAYLEDLTLDGIAEVFHLGKYHMSHIFKEATGYSVRQYVLLKRIAHAKDLLYYTGRDIETVAADSGFNSASNFIRAFKSAEGITPGQFRRLRL